MSYKPKNKVTMDERRLFSLEDVQSLMDFAHKFDYYVDVECSHEEGVMGNNRFVYNTTLFKWVNDENS